MHDDINTKRTELANDFAAAGAALLDFTGTACAMAAIPDTEPQQYVAAGTPENIAAILPATICPQRRQKHGERPSAGSLEFDEPAATSGDAPDLQQLKADEYGDRLSMKAVLAIRDSIKPGDGWGGDEWDYALANAVAAHCARIESATAPATASGDELPPLTMSVYGTRTNLGLERQRRADIAAHAAVSAATKPTANLSSLTRYSMWSNGAAHGCDPAINGRWVEFDDVQSLLATKPATAVPEGWKLVPLEADDGMINAYEVVAPSPFSLDGYRAMIAATPAASTTGAAQTAEQVLTKNECDVALRWLDVTRLYAFVDPEDEDLSDKLNKIRLRPTPTHSSEAGE